MHLNGGTQEMEAIMARQEEEIKLEECVGAAERLDSMLRVEMGEQKEDDSRIGVCQLLADEAFGLVSGEEVETKRQELRALKLKSLERPLLITELRKREKEVFKERTKIQKRVNRLLAQEDCAASTATFFECPTGRVKR
jgi:predicted Zn-dependent peptidase